MPFTHKPVRTFTGKPSKAALAAREHMRRNGWSYRRAAAALNCSHPHLALVLTGHRISHSLCRRVLELPAAN
jgi:hypothetical protein